MPAAESPAARMAPAILWSFGAGAPGRLQLRLVMYALRRLSPTLLVSGAEHHRAFLLSHRMLSMI
eukprot:14010146-Heterocapsa_arctica.AAC.1